MSSPPTAEADQIQRDIRRALEMPAAGVLQDGERLKVSLSMMDAISIGVDHSDEWAEAIATVSEVRRSI